MHPTQLIIDWCFCTTLLPITNSHSPVDGKVIVNKHCVCGCIVIGRNTRHGNTIVCFERFTWAWSWTFSTTIGATFGSNVSMAIRRVCVSTIYCWVRNMQQIIRLMNGILRTTLKAMFLMIPNPGRAWKSWMRMCREMTLCTGTASSGTVFSKECGQVWHMLLCSVDQKTVDQALASAGFDKITTVRCILMTFPTEMTDL